MTVGILVASAIILVCVLLNKAAQKSGIPMLLAFIVLGLIFGTDGIFRIPFENYDLVEKICSTALIFIMFYGGFGTNWKQAKPVVAKSVLLASIGVVFTALITGVICHFMLGIPIWESLLIGAVISSTDAASVFSILRSKKLGLKNNTDSMLELESGSNDPCSYMLTIIFLTIMEKDITAGSVLYLIFAQFVFGILIGAAIGYGSAFFMRRFRFATDGFDMAFATGIALLSYGASAVAGGNGYLSAYICGIILGNHRIHNQKALVHFFNGVTGLMQMLIFFLLGLLATPSRIPSVFLTALLIMLILTFIARPLSIFMILSPFRCSIRQQLLVSVAGLRGAASIVFAVMAIISPPQLENDLYHIVFCVVLLSLLFQGTFLPACARRLGMTDQAIDVLKTFSDYSEESELQFIKAKLEKGHPWSGMAVRSVTLPPDTLIIMLLRDGKRLVPSGKTKLLDDDVIILSAYKYCDGFEISLQEYTVESGSEWIDKTIQEFSPRSDELVVMVIRGNQTILPNGKTRIKEGDIFVLHSTNMDVVRLQGGGKI